VQRVAGALLAVVATGCVSSAHARPVVIVIEDSASIISPDPSWEAFGRHVAMEGERALAHVDRFIPDQNTESGIRHDGAALLFHNVGNTWSYVDALGSIDVIDECTTP
jgi:hypothetical protein